MVRFWNPVPSSQSRRCGFQICQLKVIFLRDSVKKDGLKTVKSVFSPFFGRVLAVVRFQIVFFTDVRNYLNLFTIEQTSGKACFLFFKTGLGIRLKHVASHEREKSLFFMLFAKHKKQRFLIFRKKSHINYVSIKSLNYLGVTENSCI